MSNLIDFATFTAKREAKQVELKAELKSAGTRSCRSVLLEVKKIHNISDKFVNELLISLIEHGLKKPELVKNDDGETQIIHEPLVTVSEFEEYIKTSLNNLLNPEDGPKLA